MTIFGARLIGVKGPPRAERKVKVAFTEKELEEAIDRALAGGKLKAVTDSSPVSLSTLKRKVAARNKGRSIERQRPGPAPLLLSECEADIVTWIAAMQRRLVPVQPWEVLEAANERHHMIHSNLRSVKDLTTGWYNRFVDHHPELSLRSSEWISRARNEADAASMGAFFYELTKLVIEHNISSSRVWNLDETSFVSKHQSSSVFAVRGSSNVWSKITDTSFHLSAVAAVSAGGRAAQPLYICQPKVSGEPLLTGVT
ncbi:unnamed protein product [Phytophthora fragariaefolia]|uniref:Unnamed protein product n=1 Tax=Phytophthora fragariaefolia TaxID=1490495 RepID=A0A9W6Y2V9_9STRA|nr:unnamed protein product [Phytophthora fragariaefolia]